MYCNTLLHTIVNGRKWTIVHSDGVPYVFAANLQDNTFICSSCSKEVSREDCEEHGLSHMEDIEFEHLFKEIVLRSGSGHYEMTMSKCLLRLGW